MYQPTSVIKEYCLKFIAGFAIFAMSMPSSSAVSQDFTHEFSNPAFGGHPNNFQYFMQSAELQKSDFSDADDDPLRRRDPLQDFQQTMQRQLLSQLSRELVSGDMGDFDFTEEGVYDLGDFSIQVTPGLDVITIDIIDELSGDQTQVEIPRF